MPFRGEDQGEGGAPLGQMPSGLVGPISNYMKLILAGESLCG
jgi:hypothetical protein